MKLLVITDNFSGGGLETQIAGQVSALKANGISFFLATGLSDVDADQAALFEDVLPALHFGPSASYLDLNQTLDALQRFVEVHNIDLVHAHPFYSSVVGALAAQRCQIPYVVTLHGPASIASMSGIALESLFTAGSLPGAKAVFCVSPETKILADAHSNAATVLLPNAVEIIQIDEAGTADHTRWMWAGRIDDEKIVGLLSLIDMMVTSNIQLDVYGDGPAVGKLQEYITSGEGRRDFVKLCGWHRDVTSEMAGYSLVAGMGRVILEAASRNRMCLMVGYDGVKCFINAQNIASAAFWNFSGRGYKNMSADEFERSISQLGLQVPNAREWVVENRSSDRIWKDYLEHLQTEFRHDAVLSAAVDVISLKGQSDELAWDSLEFADLVEGLVRNSQVDSLTDNHWMSRFSKQSAHQKSIRNEQASLVVRVHELQRLLDLEATNGRSLKASLEGMEQAAPALVARITELEKALQQEQLNIEQINADAQARLSKFESTLKIEKRKQDELLDANSALKAETNNYGMKLAALDSARNAWEFRAKALESSTSWQITRPLRISSEALRLLFDRSGKATKRYRHLATLSRTIGPVATLTWLFDRLAHGRKLPPIASPMVVPSDRSVRQKYRTTDGEIVGRIGFYISSLEVIGGLEIWAKDIANQLSELGYDVSLIVRDAEPNSNSGQEFLARFPFNVFFLHNRPENLDSVAREASLDTLVINHCYEGVEFLSKSIFVTEVVHNIYFWQKDRPEYETARLRVDHFVAVSTYAKEYAVQHLSVPDELITVIPHVLSVEGLYRPYKNYLDAVRSDTKFRILCVANYYPQKNLICLIKAFSRISSEDVELVLVGEPAEPQYLANMKNAIRSEGVSDRVALLGPLSRRELSAEFSRANMFVLPSLYEGYGLAALEAQYFGLPVVVSNTGYAEGFVDAECSNGLVVTIAQPFDKLSAERINEVSVFPTESSITKLHAAIAEILENYESYRKAAAGRVLNQPATGSRDDVSGYIRLFSRNKSSN